LALPDLPEARTLYSSTAIELALARPLRFEPPMIECATRPDGFRYWWHLIEYALDVNDPAAIPLLPQSLTDDEETSVRRYIKTAEELCEMTLLNHALSFEVREDDAGVHHANIDTGPVDARRGFMATFRQLYSGDKSSFRRIHGILMSYARCATDVDAVVRVDELKRWSKAVNRCDMRLVERLVLERADDRGDHQATEEETRFIRSVTRRRNSLARTSLATTCTTGAPPTL
jgi:hypothetical protein